MVTPGPGRGGVVAIKARVEAVDLEGIAQGIGTARRPLVPAVRALQHPYRPEHRECLHHGPITQHVLDTATALRLREAQRIFRRDPAMVGGEVSRLAQAHRATPMGGRTPAVQALPITFGHECAACRRPRSACASARCSCRCRRRSPACGIPAAAKGKGKVRPGYSRSPARPWTGGVYRIHVRRPCRRAGQHGDGPVLACIRTSTTGETRGDLLAATQHRKGGNTSSRGTVHLW